jgi:hypothetical protein
MALPRISRSTAKTLRNTAGLLAATALAAGLAIPATAAAASASTASTASTPAITWGTLDSQPGHAAAEHAAGVTGAMTEFSWASFEPAPGVLSASYLATMKSILAAYTAAGQHVTLGLGLEDPPAWVLKLPDAAYTDNTGAVTPGTADLVHSAAVRSAAATYLALIAARIPLTAFTCIRLGAGNGQGEMLYPGNGTYQAFSHAALTGAGLPAGMTPNPYPAWRPGRPGLTRTQIDQWVTWYIGGLDNLTSWEMTTLTRLGFTGTYQLLTPGSGTRPSELARTEQHNLSNDGTTGVGAVWDRYYAQLPVKTRAMAYISSVADNSGSNDSCQPADATLSPASPAMDTWSATRWITRIARHNGLPAGGENPGLNLPASLDTFYTNTTTAGMMAAATRQARTCALTAFYWAHDIHLWDGTIPFTTYTSYTR